MAEIKSRNQKFFTPQPGVRDWITDYARTIPAAGKGAPSVVVNAAIAAFRAMPEEEQAEWLSRIMFPQQQAAVDAVRETASRTPKSQQRRKGGKGA